MSCSLSRFLGRRAAMSYFLFIISGIVLYLAGVIWVTVLAFTKSFWWGLGCVFFPPTGLFFVLYYHPKLRIPLLLKLCGVVLIIGGALGLKHLGILN